MFRRTQEDENSKGFPSFELTHESGRCIYGSIENGFVNWNWQMSDSFTPAERLDALEFVQNLYGI